MTSTKNTVTSAEDDLLGALTSGVEAPQPELRARFAQRADSDGVLDVAYTIVDSPVGPLLVACTAEGVVRVAFEREDHAAVLESLSASISPRILRAPQRTDAVARELDEYFTRDRRSFDVVVDLRLVNGFRRSVVSHLREIPYGETATYAGVAAAAGNPAAVRAAASACSHNPVPLVVPCHRVVRSDGSIGGYLGGAEAKASLLALERMPSRR